MRAPARKPRWLNPAPLYAAKGMYLVGARKFLRCLIGSENFRRHKFKSEDIVLILVLLSLLIPFGVGVLATMELRTPPPTAVAVIQPLAETAADTPDSLGALAKADRLEFTAPSSETPAQPVAVDERIPSPEGTAIGSPPEGITPGSSEPPRVINRHRHHPKSRKVATVALPKPKPKATDIKRTIVSARSTSASDTESCRLAAFGGLRKALNSADCEI
jgi:hypothetical protein